MKKQFYYVLMGILLLSTMALIYGCGSAATSGGSAAAGGTTYFGTQSGGDTWKWVIGSSTFSGENFDKKFSISGTYVTRPSGFRYATITASSTIDIPSDGSAHAYFLEFPNTMLLIKPTGNDGGSDDKVIVCGAAASTAPTSNKYNFINIPKNNWIVSDGAFGTAEAKFTGNSYTFEVWNRKMDNTTDMHTVEGGWVFESAGYFSHPGFSTKIFVAPSGIFCGDNGTGEGGFVGAIADNTNFPNLAAAQTAVVGKTFRGVLFKYHSASDTGETEAVGATGEAGGIIRGASFTSVDTSAEPNYVGGSVTIEFTSLTNGLATGTLTEPGKINPMHLMLAKIGGKIMVFGISTSEYGGPSPEPYNFLVIEQ